MKELLESGTLPKPTLIELASRTALKLDRKKVTIETHFEKFALEDAEEKSGFPKYRGGGFGVNECKQFPIDITFQTEDAAAKAYELIKREL